MNVISNSSPLQNGQTEITTPFNPSDVDMTTRHHTVDLLMNRIRRQEIDLQPSFQRKTGIWDVTQKSSLIESLLLRIPIPAFYIAADTKDDWIIVDGQQRLHTLYNFIHKQAFVLSNLEFLNHFNAMGFSQLPRNMQRRILETEFVIHAIEPGTPKEVTYTIFKRINTSGLPLSAQEIRHALYQGASVEFLKKLADSKPFKRATNNDIIDDRMTDHECILRYLAFVMKPIERYDKLRDMNAFLSQTMVHLNQASPELFEKLQRDFYKSMTAARKIFDKQAFRKRYKKRQYRTLPINRGLFETWSVELSKCNHKQIETLFKHRAVIKERFIQLMAGNYLPTGVGKKEKFTFEQSISEHTFNNDRVSFRFKVIRGFISEILKEFS
ncbi:MAG: DUF262 domain-containing protein [Pseudomonadota bacterium]